MTRSTTMTTEDTMTTNIIPGRTQTPLQFLQNTPNTGVVTYKYFTVNEPTDSRAMLVTTYTPKNQSPVQNRLIEQLTPQEFQELLPHLTLVNSHNSPTLHTALYLLTLDAPT